MGGRQSLGMGRDRTSFGGRPSMGGRSSLGGSMSRRSSVHANASGTSDPRPLSDKAYKSQSVRGLIQFLTENGYTASQLSPKQLSAPSNKDFIRIFQFIYSFIDPNYNWGKSKAEDEIPQLFKTLGYPFTINKSAIFSCGSPHNWPKLLGALTWLIELATYQQSAGIDQRIFQLGAGEEFEQETAGENEIFFDYLEKAYMAFLAGDDDFQHLEDDLAAGFQARNTEITAATARLQEGKRQQEAELAELEGKPSPLEQLTQNKTEFTQDIQKFNDLIVNLTAHLKKVQSRLQKLKAENASKDEELVHLTATVTRMQKIKEEQEMTPADVERINSARTKLDRQLHQTTGRKEELDQQTWKQEMALTKLLEETEAVAASFNKKAEQLRLIPSTACNANGVDYTVTINARAENPEDIVSVDLRGVVRPALASLRDSINDMAHSVQSELLSAREMVAKMNEAVKSKQDDVSILESRISAMEEHYQRDDEVMRDEYKTKIGAVESLQQEVARMRMAASSAHLESEGALEKMRLDFEAMKAACISEKEAVNKAILRALHIVTAHKDHIVTELAQLKSFALGLRN